MTGAVTDDDLLALLHTAAGAASSVFERLTEWGEAGTRDGQYHSDLAVDPAVVEALVAGGVGVLSEETGLHHGDRDVIVVADPLDGSTNAAYSIPWFATSLCALDGDGARVALVVNQATGTTFEARRGGGATRDGVPIAPRRCDRFDRAVVGIAGHPGGDPGWWQFRSFGAAALDLCAVASGLLDGYADFVPGGCHGPWDYLAGALVCTEAGAVVGEAAGRPLVTTDHRARRAPAAAVDETVLTELLALQSRGN